VHHIGRADDDSLVNLVALCDVCHAPAHVEHVRRFGDGNPADLR
jgi:hypothetical protein